MLKVLMSMNLKRGANTRIKFRYPIIQFVLFQSLPCGVAFSLQVPLVFVGRILKLSSRSQTVIRMAGVKKI